MLEPAKTLYDDIEQTIRQHGVLLHVDHDAQESDIRQAVRWVMRDNPDIFWFVHQYLFDPNAKTVSFRYQFSKERSELIQKSIDDVVEHDFQIGYAQTLSGFEQVMYVYKWLLSYCNYNVNSAYNQTIDSVFVRRNSVCTGYAKAAQYLFGLLGVESRLVFGRLNNDVEEGRHCWNIVVVEGQPYHLDVCFGDPSLEGILIKAGEMKGLRYGDFNYNCFCVSSAEIGKTRTLEDQESLPVCGKSLDVNEIERLSLTEIKEMNRNIEGSLGRSLYLSYRGCLLSSIGSSADIMLCARDKHVVLKVFRGIDNRQCSLEYGYMSLLKGCKHLLQSNGAYTDVRNNTLALEQSTPIVDLFCSHYYHPTLRGVLTMMRDVTEGWLECYERGIMYRDLHVCNIYKADDGTYKLGDFGSCTSRSRQVDEKVGNPWFMSPETYIRGQFDELSAVYSLTSVFYFILNGLRPPFVDGHNDRDALRLKMSGAKLPLPLLLQSFPSEWQRKILGGLIDRGCAFQPSERIQSIKEFLKVVNLLLNATTSYHVQLRFSPLCAEELLCDAPATIIVRDPFHKFAYGKDMECISTTRTSAFFDDEKTDIQDHYSSTKDIVRNCSQKYTRGEDVEAATATEYLPGSIKRNYQTIVADGKGGSVGRCQESELDGNDGVCAIPPLDPVESKHKTATFAPKPSLWSRLFRKGKGLDSVYSSVFAPAEVKPKSHMLVQVFLHLFEETEKVKILAKESQKDASRRDYIPLQCKLKKGDKVDVQLNIYGESLLMSEQKSVIWQGSFTKCSFMYFVPGSVSVQELSCIATLSVNGIPVGEMTFITGIVNTPRQLNPEIISHKYKKVFISYSHKDEAKVKFLAEGFELMNIPHFFDRHNLKTGDIFPVEIQHYIDTADLFILCWSENASKSDYVKKELKQALKRAYPQIRPPQAAELAIYPMSIEPRAELPADMKEYYHFGQL